MGGPNQQKFAVIPIFIRTSPWAKLSPPTKLARTSSTSRHSRERGNPASLSTFEAVQEKLDPRFRGGDEDMWPCSPSRRRRRAQVRRRQSLCRWGQFC